MQLTIAKGRGFGATEPPQVSWRLYRSQGTPESLRNSGPFRVGRLDGVVTIPDYGLRPLRHAWNGTGRQAGGAGMTGQDRTFHEAMRAHRSLLDVLLQQRPDGTIHAVDRDRPE